MRGPARRSSGACCPTSPATTRILRPPLRRGRRDRHGHRAAALAFGLYAVFGDPAALEAGPPQRPRAPAAPASLPARRDELVRHLARNARDGRGWVLLARMDFEADRFADAAASYEKALATSPKIAADAGVWCEYADALGMAQGGALAGRPRELVMRALALDPAHPKALEMAGSAAYEQRRFRVRRAATGGSSSRSFPSAPREHRELAAAIARAERLAARRERRRGERSTDERGDDATDVDVIVVGGGISGLAAAFGAAAARRVGRSARRRRARRRRHRHACTATARSTRPGRTARSTRRRSSTSCSTRSAFAASAPMRAPSPPRASSCAAASSSRCRRRRARSSRRRRSRWARSCASCASRSSRPRRRTPRNRSPRSSAAGWAPSSSTTRSTRSSPASMRATRSRSRSPPRFRACTRSSRSTAA